MKLTIWRRKYVGCLGSDSVTVGNLSSAGQDPKQRVRVLHGVRGHQRELHVNFSLVQKGGSLALEAEQKALTLCVIRLLEPVLCGRCLGMECNAPASSDSPAAWHTAVRRACHFRTECQADDLVQPEADMENLHLRRDGWMPLRASNFPMLTRASDSGMGELLPAVFGARAIASRTDSVVPLCGAMEYKLAVDSSKKATELPLLRVCGTVQQNPHMRAFWASTISFFLAFLGCFVAFFTTPLTWHS